MRTNALPDISDDIKHHVPGAVDPTIVRHLGRRFRLRPLVAIVVAQAIGLGAR